MSCSHANRFLAKYFSLTIISLQVFIFSSCKIDEKENAHRLAKSSSPYLRQHADNPVEWYEWGPEALDKAKNENKPLLISIGYASCHWCHVMEEESFMDTAVARVMNENFVSVKIDREQRPDIDQIYIHAAQLISGSAGWPLNAFALPDGKPFYAGTYFPKDEWLALLAQVSDAYREDRNTVIRQAEALTRGISKEEIFSNVADSAEKLTRKKYADSFSQWSAHLDFRNGGQRGAIKFPMPVIWESFLQFHFLTGDARALGIVKTTLDNMAGGGIYDKVGGGFSRYSTDSAWRVPHFEKMLYDNAQLVSLYAHAYQVTKEPSYKMVIAETLDFIRREMTGPGGAFYSSINADSEEGEGKFYAWTRREIEQIVGQPFADAFCDYYNVTASGNWNDGLNILFTAGSDDWFASKSNMTKERWNGALRQAKDKLYQRRTFRTAPSTDMKIITSWNALMITGYLDAYAATSNSDYLDAALMNAEFLKSNMMASDGKLLRSYINGTAEIDAFLDDYANLALAFLKLYQKTFDINWLHRARALVDYTTKHFFDAESGLFYYASDANSDLIVRKKELSDEVIPSSNSVLAEVFLLLGEFYYDAAYTKRAEKMLAAIAHAGPGLSIYHANWIRISALTAWTPFMTAILGEEALTTCREIQKEYHPLALFSGGTREDLPILENKLIAGKTIIYVCRNRVCRLPVQEVAQAIDQLEIID